MTKDSYIVLLFDNITLFYLISHIYIFITVRIVIVKLLQKLSGQFESNVLDMQAISPQKWIKRLFCCYAK